MCYAKESEDLTCRPFKKSGKSSPQRPGQANDAVRICKRWEHRFPRADELTQYRAALLRASGDLDLASTQLMVIYRHRSEAI